MHNQHDDLAGCGLLSQWPISCIGLGPPQDGKLVYPRHTQGINNMHKKFNGPCMIIAVLVIT